MKSTPWPRMWWIGALTLFVVIGALSGQWGTAMEIVFSLTVSVWALSEYRRRAELERQIWVESSAVSFWLTVSGILAYGALAPAFHLPKPDIWWVALGAVALQVLIQVGMNVTHSD